MAAPSFEQSNDDLHGNAPDNSSMALLIIDMLSDFEFPDGDRLFESALLVARRIAALKQELTQFGVPTIYVNDNFGKWRSDFKCVVEHCMSKDVRGEPIARLLRPLPEDYFVLKPKHSAFYATPLDVLLAYLKTRTVVITGVRADSCVLLSASEAHVRDFQLVVPSDCTAALSNEAATRSLQHMREVLDAATPTSSEWLTQMSEKRLSESRLEHAAK